MTATIYRELQDPEPNLTKWLEDRDQLFVVLDPKGVEHIYVDNGTPRDSWVNEMIVGGPLLPYAGCTKRFALFSEEGDFIAEYSRIDTAEKALKSLRTVVDVIDDPDDKSGGLSWNSDMEPEEPEDG